MATRKTQHDDAILLKAPEAARLLAMSTRKLKELSSPNGGPIPAVTTTEGLGKRRGKKRIHLRWNPDALRAWASGATVG